MSVPAETCASCRFDGAQYDLQDTLGTLRSLAPMWTHTIEDLPEAVLNARPAPHVWAVTEHLTHSADRVADLGRLLHATLTIDDLTLPEPPPPGEPAPEPRPAALERLDAQLRRLHDKAASLDGEDDVRWRRTVVVGDREVDAAWILRHAVHDVTHHLRDVGRGLHQLGAGAPSQEGTVAQLSVSDGGVPKRPVEWTEVGDRGLIGDRQTARVHHGRPLQALCLWSTEVIDALRAEGHPIGPGDAGENITLAGIDWSTLRPGVQILIGEVLAEVSAWSSPCSKNAQWFVDGDFNRMDHERHPGWSRVYAWVREPGTVRQGDRVVVEP